MATLDEILADNARIKNELQRMENDPETTEENDGDMRDTLIAEYNANKKRAEPLINRMKAIRQITSAADDESNLEKGSPDLVVRTRQDPYQDMEAVRSHMVRTPDLVSRALDAIEFENKQGRLEHDFAETATGVIQRAANNKDKRGIAEHILRTGTPEYREAFEAYLENPSEMASRAALSLTLANGGYLLPFVLDPTIILTNSGSANPWRRISAIKQTTSNTWNGVNSAGVNAAMLGEGSVFADATPTVGNIVVTPQKATAWIFGSYEVLEDTDFGQQLPRLLADAKDRLEESQFATGNGTPPNTQGVVTAATTVVTTATTTVIALGDVYAVQAALPARFRNSEKAAWAANVAIINKVRQLDTAGGASFWTNLGKGQPETLLGAPIYESTTMTSAVSSGALEAIFGDFSQFIIVDRVGVSMIYEPLIKDTSTGRPTGQAGWTMFWRFGSQVSTVNAFRVMKGA